jgi:hypothetical protein
MIVGLHTEPTAHSVHPSVCHCLAITTVGVRHVFPYLINEHVRENLFAGVFLRQHWTRFQGHVDTKRAISSSLCVCLAFPT